ncbi:MAG: hypothetical protein AAB499_00655 [Patescibacteria group bacterium]
MKVALAAFLLITGSGLVSVSMLGGGTLAAASVAETGFDWSQLLLWAGILILVFSAGLFVISGSQ